MSRLDESHFAVAELAWAAGLFEGEGTVTIAKRSRDDTYRLVAIVTNTDEQIIDFFVERWGGWKQGLYGERPGRKPGWSWTVAGPGAATFLQAIEPWVRTTRVREKIDLGLYFKACQSRRRRVFCDPAYRQTHRELYAQMRDLNRRGVEV